MFYFYCVLGWIYFLGGQEMKVTNVKFINKETGKVVLNLDQAEVDMKEEKIGGQDELTLLFVKKLMMISKQGWD